MEYVYSAMLLHAAGKEITEENVTKILAAVGIESESSRVKALVASLEGVDIEDAISSAAFAPAPAGSAPAAEAPSGDSDKKEKKEEKEEEEEVSEESAAEGLSALFG